MALPEEKEQIVERVVDAANDIVQTINEGIIDRVNDDSVGYIEDNIIEDVAIAMEELADTVRDQINGVTVIFDLDNDNSSDETSE
jgi:hypothetical protein|nr:MAG TPA: hypothetical protein [Caudoviricetes sp.]